MRYVVIIGIFTVKVVDTKHGHVVRKYRKSRKQRIAERARAIARVLEFTEGR